MANPDSPFGFRIYNHGAGGCPNRVNEYPLGDAYGTALFEGDLVALDASGNVIIVTSDTAVFVGIFMGVKWTGTDGSFNYSNNWVASTATKSGTVARALVMDDPSVLLYAQNDGTAALVDVGQYAGVDTSQAGDAVTGRSRQQVVHGGAETQFRIVKIIEDKPIRNAAGNQDMLAAGANAQVVLKPINHQNSFAAASAAAEI